MPTGFTVGAVENVRLEVWLVEIIFYADGGTYTTHMLHPP